MGLEFEAVRAPELRGTAWLNTARPLTLADLRGKLVLLDFWTYCCINCLHVLEDLKYLEHKYADQPFAVVGVHSPKFPQEDDAESVRQAIVRYGIAHPVLLDSGRKTWDAYGVRGWPTLVLLDPRGYVLGRVSGEGNRERLDGAISQALELLAQAEVLDGRPLSLRLESETGAMDVASPLLYPGKVLADAASETLFVADTGHHRLVRAGLDGAGAAPIGSGESGAADGDLATATFRAPQGLALDTAHSWLYVADTGNHLIRRVDLAAGTVTTVAGTGAQGLRVRAGGPARETPLNSPWDVCLLDGTLYIAMAGSHQIWTYDPAHETVEPFAGNGAEGRADGPVAQAAFAQPSGLATDGSRLYVADSEISAVRVIELDAAGGARVRTLAGGDLFQFGDRDGRGDQARMQHPLGIAWVPVGMPRGGAVYVADTYNHKLRRLEPAMRELSTFAGNGAAGDVDGPMASVRFSEPSGLSYANGQLYVADTNNHAIRVATLRDGRVSTLALAGLCAPGVCLPG
ncbi:MAG TPA: thioredoxin-like domain-containing protein [Ktedonobacterales bacterium]